MVDGERHRFSLNDDKAALIREHVARWSQLVEAGPDQWQVLRRSQLPSLSPPTART